MRDVPSSPIVFYDRGGDCPGDDDSSTTTTSSSSSSSSTQATTTSSSSSSSSTSAAPTVGPQSVNLVTNGDFETGNYVPWYIISQTGAINPSVVRSDSTPGFPASHPTGGNYALKFDILPTGGFKAISFGNTLTTTTGQNYRVSFEVSGCGGANDQVNVVIAGKTINSFVLQGDCATWTPVSGTFTGTGSDVIDIQIFSVSFLTSSQWYFDNFVVAQV